MTKPRARGAVWFIGGLRSRIAAAQNWLRRWGLLVVTLLLWAWWTWVCSGSITAGAAMTAATVTAFLYATWQSRRKALAKSGIMADRLTIWVHLCDLVRVWMLFVLWPRAVHHAHFTRHSGDPVVLPMPRPSRSPDTWWYFDKVTGVVVTRSNIGRYGVLYEDMYARCGPAGALTQFTGAYDTTVRHLRSAKPIARGRLAGIRNATRAMSGVVEIRFHFNDPVGTRMALRELPTAAKGRISIGRFSDRSVASIRADLSFICYGMTGMGKSNVVRTLLADLIRSKVPVEVYVIDPKSQEMRRFKRHVGKSTNPYFQVKGYADDSDAASTMIAKVAKVMADRQQTLGDDNADSHTPTLEMPMIYVIIDEYLAITDEAKKAIAVHLRKIVFTGRASGVAVWALAQDPTKEAIGPIRDLFPQKFTLKLTSPDSSRPALGVAGAPVTTLSGPGVGLLMRDGDEAPSMVRIPLVISDEYDMIADGRVPDMPGDEVMGEETIVYRYYGRLPADQYPQFADEDGHPQVQLLYVGITNKFKRRHQEHVDREKWTDWIDDDLTVQEVFRSRPEAKAEETRLIHAELPLFNIDENEDNPHRQQVVLRPVDDPRRKTAATRWHRGKVKVNA